MAPARLSRVRAVTAAKVEQARTPAQVPVRCLAPAEPGRRNPARSMTAVADRAAGRLDADRPNQAGDREAGYRAQYQAHQPGADHQDGGMALARGVVGVMRFPISSVGCT